MNMECTGIIRKGNKNMNIKRYLNESKDFYDISVFDVLDSTNTTLKEAARKGEKKGKVIIAKEQTMGRGKMNRSFFSPKDSGIYMSILLRADMELCDAVFITAMTAVAVSEAIESVSKEEAKIKWVNDIYCKGRKVCGILTESGVNLDSGKADYSVVGIGINLKQAEGGFPDDILHIAGAVFDENGYTEDKKEKIIAEVLERLYKYYLKLGERTFIEKYKERSNLIGKEITVTNGNEIKKATAIRIDDDCRLVVKYDNGDEEALFSGDVSIKI